MPIENLGKKHVTPQQVAKFDEALTTLTDILINLSPNLTNDERARFGSVNEQNKLLVNSVQDYYHTQPSLSTPDVDWDEFSLDHADRVFADTRINKLGNLQRMLSDFKIVHDYDNYKNALVDYDFATYKSGTNTPGFAEKYNKLKMFFPKANRNTQPPKDA